MTKSEPWALTGRPLPIPKCTKAMRKALRTLKLPVLQSFIDAQERPRFATAAMVFGVRPEELLLYHEGSDGRGLRDELKIHAERVVSRSVYAPFEFTDNRFFQWFVVQSRLLWRYYGACPQLDTWSPDQFARGFLLPSYGSYLQQIAHACTITVRSNAENDRFFQEHYPRRTREVYIGDWHDEVREWLVSQNEAERTDRTLQSWARKARSKPGWRVFCAFLHKERSDANHATSLKNPLAIEWPGYLETWKHVSNQNSVTQGHWIGLGEIAHSDYRSARKLFEAAVSGINFDMPPPGLKIINGHRVFAGPVLDLKRAKVLSRQLKAKGLGTGEIVDSDLELTFYRPAARDQWWRPCR